uniref:Uncharacterized protein n=1 Tax=Pristionchus pacificus TaxID=54126 RepID=A0A2A6CUQ1_PRIPA|eukprot:PDM81816.1 hypothetical protein PRIPAC_33970 [Pristionchus pacificus]
MVMENKGQVCQGILRTQAASNIVDFETSKCMKASPEKAPIVHSFRRISDCPLLHSSRMKEDVRMRRDIL